MNAQIVWMLCENSDNATPGHLFENLDVAKRKAEALAKSQSYEGEPFHWEHDQTDDSWSLCYDSGHPFGVLYKFTKHVLPEGVEWRIAEVERIRRA